MSSSLRLLRRCVAVSCLRLLGHGDVMGWKFVDTAGGPLRLRAHGLSRRGSVALFALALLHAARARAERNKPDAIVVIGHPSLAPMAKGRLDRAKLAALFTLRAKRLGDIRVRPLNLPASHPVRHTFDHAVLGMSPERSRQFWIDSRVRGHGLPPKEVPSPSLIARVVPLLPGGIGYVPEAHVGDGVVVLARIEKGKLRAP